MELTLTGPSNAVVVRNVLLPSQYLENPRAQAAEARTQLFAMNPASVTVSTSCSCSHAARSVPA